MTDPVVVGNDGKYFQVCHYERFEGQLLDVSFVSTVYTYIRTVSSYYLLSASLNSLDQPVRNQTFQSEEYS